jgi:TolB-like protein
VRALALLVVAGCGRVSFDQIGDGSTSSDGVDAVDSAPLGSARIASVQNPSATMTTTPVFATISPVDATRTLVLCDFRTPDSGAANMPTCELTDATSLTITTGRTDINLIVAIQVIEFSGPVRVQRGVESFTTSDSFRDVTISSIDRAKTFAVVSRRSSYTFNNADSDYAVTAELTGATTLRLTRNVAGTGTLDVAWQVIEIEGASVQSGTTTINSNQTVGSSTLANVDMASTFLVSSYRTDSSAEGEYLARAELVSPTALTMTRNVSSTDTVTVAWFAVSFPLLRVQRGGVATTNQILVGAGFAAVDVTRSFLVTTVSGGLSGDLSSFDETMCTTAINGPTNLVAQRAMASAVNGAVSWSVIEWPL